MLPCVCLNRMIVFAEVRKHKVPPLRFASVGMTELLVCSVRVTELLREGIVQADWEEFVEEEGMDARIEGSGDPL